MKRFAFFCVIFSTVTCFGASDPNLGRKVILPGAGSRVENGADAYLTADFLYLQARQDNLDYAVTASSAAAGGDANLPTGKTYAPDFKFEPGFRAGLGVGVGHDAWDVYLQYSWYQHNFNKTSVTHSDNTVQTMIMSPNWNYSVGSPITFASGEWSMRSSILDGELGRDSFLSPYLSVRPFFGVRASWQDQTYNTVYQWLDSGVETTNSINQKLKIFGVGLRTGSNATWSFNRNWSIYSNVAFATLFSRFKTDAKNTQSISTGSALGDYVNSKQSAIQPIIELAFGLGWDVWFEDDSYHLGLRAGWEQQVWFSNNYFLAPAKPNFIGDLYMQGLVLKLRFDF